MQKRSEKAWGILSHDPHHDNHNYVVTPPLGSQVMYETDLAFCATCSFEMGQAPSESYTERMKHTQAKAMTPKGC